MNKVSDALDQLAALAGLNHLLHSHDIGYWLFGDWAVDIHTGRDDAATAKDRADLLTLIGTA